MSKFFKELCDFWLIYVFRFPIIIVIILLIILGVGAKKSLDKEYKQLGYSGFYDNTITYDKWTDEVIPKNQIGSDEIKEKSIATSKGNITEKELEEYLNKYNDAQGSRMFITNDRVDKVRPIVDELFSQRLGIEYTIEKEAKMDVYEVHLKNFDIGETHYDDYSFESTEDLRDILEKIFKANYNNNKSQVENKIQEENSISNEENSISNQSIVTKETLNNKAIYISVIICFTIIVVLIVYIQIKKHKKRIENDKKIKEEYSKLSEDVNKTFSYMGSNELLLIYNFIREYFDIENEFNEINLRSKEDNNLYNSFLTSYQLIHNSDDLSEKTINYNYFKNIYILSRRNTSKKYICSSSFDKFDGLLFSQFRGYGRSKNDSIVGDEDARELYNKSLETIFYQNGSYYDEKVFIRLNNADMFIATDFTSAINKNFNQYTIKKLLEYFYKILEYSNNISVVFKTYEKVRNIPETSEFFKIIKNISTEIKDIDLIVKDTKPIYDKFYKESLLCISDINIYKIFIQLLISKINENSNCTIPEESTIDELIETTANENKSIEEFINLCLIYIKNNIAKNDFKIFIDELYNINNYVENYKNKLKNNKIKTDKERYLSGNFEQEKIESNLKYSFKNIKTVQEFE